MTAIVSFTDDSRYAYFAPLVKWAWEKIGHDSHFLIPNRSKNNPIWRLIYEYTQPQFYSYFNSDIEKEVTYSQVGRLYMASEFGECDDVLICSDADMLPINKNFFDNISNGNINIVGYDLVPDGQYPMCYCHDVLFLLLNSINESKVHFVSQSRYAFFSFFFTSPFI